MDEPFSALDAITREATQAVFLEVWRQRPVTTLLVTHQVDEAVFLGSKILLLAGRPGRAASLLDNPLFERADSRSSRAFFESCLELRRKLRREGGHE